jgi:hypothetical protein
MIGAVAGRLARTIDCARLLETRVAASPDSDPMTAELNELRDLRFAR